MTRNFKLFLGATIIFYLIGAINTASAMYILSAASLAVMLTTLTVALLDQTAFAIRKILGKSAEELPLAKILQGGTWAAGRQTAQKLRPDGGWKMSPPDFSKYFPDFIAQSLAKSTKQDFGLDGGKWSEWIRGNVKD